MSEEKNNNDPIEKLFREKAEEYDISYREEDWLKLEKKLDLRNAQSVYRQRLRWLAAASILIISLLGYFTFKNYNSINQLAQQLNEETPSQSEQPPTEQSPPVSVEDLPEMNRERPPGITENRSDDVAGNDPGGITHEPREMETASEEIAATFDDGEAELLASHERSIKNITPFTSVQTPSINQSDYGVQPANTDRESRFSTASATVDAEKDQFSTSRFSLGLTMAPDFSTVSSLSRFQDPGYKIGITFHYKLHRYLSISTGIVQSVVRYAATGDDYNPPPYWSYNNASPTDILAECLIFDIPVTLKYEFLDFEQSRFFATAGLSSYYMVNEDYSFNYDSYGPDQVQNWSKRTGTRHWLSNAGFSIGYEIDVHPNWSVSAEPFVKVPIKEVGWGNVKLYSLGTFVSINYRL